MGRFTKPFQLVLVVTLFIAGCGQGAASTSSTGRKDIIRASDLEGWVRSEDIGKSFADANTLSKGVKSDQVRRVQAYLETYGYLMPRGFSEGEFDDATLQSFKDFQSFFGLQQSGVFDEATRKFMSLPRCGLPDRHFGIRAVTRCPWKAGTIRYYFSNYSRTCSKADCENALAAACKTWRQYVDFDFEKVDTEAAANVVIHFFVGDVDPDHYISSNVTSHSDWPDGDFKQGEPCWFIVAGKKPMHFNEKNFVFTVGAHGGKYDLQSIVLHEMGHIIGLDHSPTHPDAVMYTYPCDGVTRRELSADDIEGITRLYPNPTKPKP